MTGPDADQSTARTRNAPARPFAFPQHTVQADAWQSSMNTSGSLAYPDAKECGGALGPALGDDYRGAFCPSRAVQDARTLGAETSTE